MPRSLNLKWAAALCPEDSQDLRPGRWFAAELRRQLSACGWRVAEPGDWRDVGWCLIGTRGASSVSLFMAHLVPGEEWLLQLAPTRLPGLIGRLRGQQPSATPAELLGLARAVHAAFVQLPRVSSVRWRWDGIPDEHASREPAAS
jgi:hypothetical protein